jgi:hypothetical protein
MRFNSILSIAQSEYTKQGFFHRKRCQGKFNNLLHKWASKQQPPQGSSNSQQLAQSTLNPSTRRSSANVSNNNAPLFTNLTDVTLDAAEEELLSKGPNFSIHQRNKEKLILEMKSGFQKLIHDVRWHFYHQSINIEGRTMSCEQNIGNLSSSSQINYPLVSDRKEIKLPPIVPEIEEVVKSCHHKYLNVLKDIERRKLLSNIKPYERKALFSLKDKELKVVPSDKGGDLCVLKNGDYEKAISEHLDKNPIYRRVSLFKVENLEEKINSVWIKVCTDNKIPRHVRNMYTSSCSSFASVQAVIKTHKSSRDNIVIRPIVNSIGSPGYNLSRFLQNILQPLINESVPSSECVINEIKNIEPAVLLQRNYPISLDVENMFHNIPRDLAMDYLKLKLQDTTIDLCSLPVTDVVNLVAVCLSCNHFKHNNNLYFQRTGLPMGNRLSGILSELFMMKLQGEIYASLPFFIPAYRYVDDLLIFATGEEEANLIHSRFNSNPYGLKFTLELPVNRSIPFLDFKVKINDGCAEFDFYRKPQRKDIFVNAGSALPDQTFSNIVTNEWSRIKNRCSNAQRLEHHNKEFVNRLRRNGHNPNILRALENKNKNHNALRMRSIQTVNDKFFLNIPFVSNNIEHKIKQSLKPLGVKIHIAHKGSQLKQVLNKNVKRNKCNMASCKLKSDLCLIKGAVYQIQCDLCKATYIGSSWRHLHTRFKEHISQKASPIYVHNSKCKGQLKIEVLTTDNNIQRMRIKEAVLIKEKKPSMNVKDDLFRSHILFE